MKRVIIIFFLFSMVFLYALDDVSTTLFNMRTELEKDKKSLYLIQTNLKNDIYKQREELMKIENRLDVILVSLTVFNGCYNDHYEYTEKSKNDLKECSMGDLFAELKSLQTELEAIKGLVELSRNSISLLKIKFKKVDEKIWLGHYLVPL